MFCSYFSTKCINNRCIEYNEKKNLFNAGRHFVTFLLPHGAPKSLQQIIDEIVDAYSNLTMTSVHLLNKMENLKKLYQTGAYLKRSSSAESQTSKYHQLLISHAVEEKCSFELISHTLSITGSIKCMSQRESYFLYSINNSGFFVKQSDFNYYNYL